MKNFTKHFIAAFLSILLPLISQAAGDSEHPSLPADVAMNRGAGSGEWLIVTVRMDSGEELPFIVDTGSTGSVLDKSFEFQLGTRNRSFRLWTMFGGQESGLYPAPKFYLGNVPLKTGRYIATYDFEKASVFRSSGIKGILGMDCLSHYCIQLDFETKKMRFLDSGHMNSTDLGEAFTLVPFNYRQTKESLSITAPAIAIHHTGLLGGTNTNLTIDTGESDDGNIESGVIKAHYLTRFAHFLIRSRDLRIGNCVWDDKAYTKLKVGTGSNSLGLRFLARHLVTFDFPNHTMYLKQTRCIPAVSASHETSKL